MLDREQLRQLHKRIIEADYAAPTELFNLVHHGLTVTIWKRYFGRRDWQAAADVATDAVVEYLKSPTKFDDKRSSLFSYLTLIARGDALNLIRDRKQGAENQQRVVELSAADGNTRDERPDVKLDADRILRDHHSDLVKEEGDAEVLRLYLSGEKDTSDYAEALGILDLAPDDQEKIVKTRKDRIKLRLKRLKESLK